MYKLSKREVPAIAEPEQTIERPSAASSAQTTAEVEQDVDRPRLLPSASASPNKIYTMRTIEEISEEFNNRTDMQANKIVSKHIGKWIKIQEEVSNVSEHKDEITVAIHRSVTRTIYLDFDKKDWKEYLETMRKGDRIIAEGKITGINRLWIGVSNCEVIDIIGAKKNR